MLSLRSSSRIAQVMVTLSRIDENTGRADPRILGLLFCFPASVGMFYNHSHRINNEDKGSQSCRIN